MDRTGLIRSSVSGDIGLFALFSTNDTAVKGHVQVSTGMYVSHSSGQILGAELLGHMRTPYLTA